MILRRPPGDEATRLTVPRRSGTPGDDLVAWGLALLVSELTGSDVVLRDVGPQFSVASRLPLGDLMKRTAGFQPSQLLRLPWLGSTEKRRRPPEGIEWVDRDVLRDDFAQLQQARAGQATRPVDGDAPAVVLRDARARAYPLYRALTNPGTQWNGFNSLVEVVQRHLLTPEGLRLILQCYRAESPLDDGELDAAMRQIAISKKGDRWRNPPGFLYPGLNKGPTMRLHGAFGTLGPASAADWRMADRGDRSLVELYLAYVGYFHVCTLLEAKHGRVVLVPAPGVVRVPSALTYLGSVRLGYSTVDEYLRARASLAYARAALRYWQALQPPERPRFGGPQFVLRGVHLNRFWMPSGNTYALARQTVAPVPAWLGTLAQQEGVEVAEATVRQHQQHLADIRGSFQEERRLSSAQRAAITEYAASLGGDMRDWLTAVAHWFAVARSVEPDRSVPLWRTEEIRRLLMALDPSHDVLAMVGHPSFQHVVRAIRAATVFAHLDRIKRRQGGRAVEQGFDPDYDLLTTLAEAAERGSAEFLRALFAFAARYNDQTMRRNERVPPEQRRPMLRDPDLSQVAAWVMADRRGLVPAALLAYGSSLPERRGSGLDQATEGAAPEVAEPIDAALVPAGLEEDEERV